MKKIEAVIKPYKLKDVLKALGEIGITKVVAEEIKGFGRRMNPASLYKVKKGMNFILEYLPKIKIYLVVSDEVYKEAAEIILNTASSREIGDGKIFISDVTECIDIRSGERGFCGNPDWFNLNLYNLNNI